ncbi:MAG: hypothetical protein NT020_00515 [Chloroflexales bacterium]|nr:hypothetical protein [Chloroflexales bacterium]
MSTQSILAYIGLIVANIHWGPDKGSEVWVDAMITTDIEIIGANATTVGLFILPFVGVAARQSEVPA